MDPLPDILRIADVAELIGVRYKTVTSMIARGRIVPRDVHAGGGPHPWPVGWHRSTILRWIEDRPGQGCRRRQPDGDTTGELTPPPT